MGLTPLFVGAMVPPRRAPALIQCFVVKPGFSCPAPGVRLLIVVTTRLKYCTAVQVKCEPGTCIPCRYPLNCLLKKHPECVRECT